MSESCSAWCRSSLIKVTLGLLGLLEFGDVDEYGADPDDVSVYSDRVKALQPKVKSARVLCCFGGNFQVKDGLATGQDASVGRLELWPNCGIASAIVRPKWSCTETPLIAAAFSLTRTKRKSGSTRENPTGAVDWQRVEDAEGLGGLLFGLAHRLCQSRPLRYGHGRSKRPRRQSRSGPRTGDTVRVT